MNESLRKRNINLAFNSYKKARGKDSAVLGEVLGIGSFAVVFDCCSDGEEADCVVKAIDSSNVNIECNSGLVRKYVNDELNSMIACRHSKYVMPLLDFYDYVIDESRCHHVYFFVMPKLVPAVEVFNEKDGNIEVKVAEMAADLLKALSFLHRNDILHRDVKLQNIYYDPINEVYVLGDLGVSRKLFSNSQAVTVIGSIIAPEILAEQPLNGSFNSDLYALSVTMSAIIGGLEKSKDAAIKKLKSLTPFYQMILAKSGAQRPEDRYETADEMLRDVGILLSERSERTRNAIPSTHMYDGLVDDLHKNNIASAEKTARIGYQNGDARFTRYYAYILMTKDRNNVRTALSLLEPLCKSSDYTAMALYGVWSIDKDGKADETSRKYLQTAADNGNVIAMYYFGRWMCDGCFGTQKNIKKGMEYIINSAAVGFKPSLLYLTKNIRRNPERYVNSDAMRDLVEFYLDGFSRSEIADEIIDNI